MAMVGMGEQWSVVGGQWSVVSIHKSADGIGGGLQVVRQLALHRG
jgi:hypothetical protein